jgi:NAD(P)-dependent dehydrogenase (short-subunit alcohol dehydrogenase family)
MDLGLAGRTAIITGGSRGIGKAIAFELAREGVDLALCARDKATLDATSKELASATGRTVVPVVVDATDRGQVDAAVEECVAALGKVDILVNSAGRPGGIATGPLPTVTDEAMLEDFNAKTFGTLRFCRAVAPHMQAQGWGRIVNIGGLSGRTPGTYSTGMRNIAITHMTRTLSMELAGSGITVNIVHPGTTRHRVLTRAVGRDRLTARHHARGGRAGNGGAFTDGPHYRRE